MKKIFSILLVVTLSMGAIAQQTMMELLRVPSGRLALG